MRKIANCRRMLMTVVLGILPAALIAQCTNHTLDWDYREFFARDNGTIRTYVSLAQSQTQYYAFGANRLTITHNYSTNANVAGVNTDHTGEAGSNGSGADVEFTGDGTITLTFASAVSSLRFSLYDIDLNQRVNVSALNGAANTNVNLTGGANITISNNNTANARATGANSTSGNSSTAGNVNVSINGPVTRVTLQITNTATNRNEGGEFWISDITACSSGSFPNNYYSVSRPFTGMPSYILTSLDGSFYYVDPATGRAKLLFTDAGHNRMNSIAYDPYRRQVYYTYSLTGSGNSVNSNQKTLRRYDYNTNTYGPLVNNITTTLNIPTFEQGIESAAAAFYDGNLYLGVEGGSQYTKSMIYRIDLDGSGTPTTFSQVYAQTSETSGGTRLHDWSDFVINDGNLYDFDGGAVSSLANMDFYRQNLLTGVVDNYTPAAGVVPRQAAVDWSGQLYNVGSPNASASGTISTYNGTDNVGSAQNITYNGVAITGSWGDAGEAFRPFCDFGDAPISYEGADPTWGLAVHEPLANLSIGNTLDVEWLKKGASTTEDTDDGIPFLPLFAPGNPHYFFQAQVFNNTGSPATLIAWLDYNANGVFDPSEGRTYTIPSSASVQTLWVSWLYMTGISPTLVSGTNTYLRMRIAPASAGMTTNNPTGYFDGGEVEDYRVRVDNYPLAVNLFSFDAKVVNKTAVHLNWEVSGEDRQSTGYQVLRSRDGQNWENIGLVAARQTSGKQYYELLDKHPYQGVSYYRLLIGRDKYSDIRTITIGADQSFTLSPNPARDQVVISVKGQTREQADVNILSIDGKVIYTAKHTLSSGMNTITIPLSKSWSAGTYLIQVADASGTRQQKLVIRR
ncbi:GEVED domain-containing protein [Terrimonas ferruginea]|uniref:GEVED domain-containing protein n=1 Tax=Terrimonas ferruginea TaxID=249 RepID=UPI0004021625|nr:GEVED domain-containing protein [Terrimonas ferruginea]